MSTAYKLDSVRDKAFFSAPKVDTVTQRHIKSGDSICICDKCGAIYFVSSWKMNDNSCAVCASKKLADITPDYFKRFSVSTEKVSARRRRPASDTSAQTLSKPQEKAAGSAGGSSSGTATPRKRRAAFKVTITDESFRSLDVFDKNEGTARPADLQVTTTGRTESASGEGNRSRRQAAIQLRPAKQDIPISRHDSSVPALPTEKAKRRYGGRALLSFLTIGSLVAGVVGLAWYFWF